MLICRRLRNAGNSSSSCSAGTRSHACDSSIIPSLVSWTSASAATFDRATHVFSSDGTRVLSGSGDNTVKLWDVATGQLVRTFDMHSAQVSSEAFSPDGARVLSGSWDATVEEWAQTLQGAAS
jgi:WD40 repeat protein